MATKGQFLVLSDLRFLPPIVETRQPLGRRRTNLTALNTHPRTQAMVQFQLSLQILQNFPLNYLRFHSFWFPLFSRAWGENQERSGTYERAAGVLNWTRAIEGPCRKAWTAQSVLFHHPPPPDLPTTLCRQLGRLRATLGLSEHSGGVGSDFSNNVELGAIQNEIWFLKWKCLEFQFVDTKMLLLSKSTQLGNSAASHLKINWVFQYKFCKHHNCSN